MAYVPSAVWELLEVSEAWERFGVLPVAGGLLDQSESAVWAVRYVGTERRRVRNALGLMEQGGQLVQVGRT